MTTIAFDGKTLAVDSQITEGDRKFFLCKLIRYNGGYLTVTGMLKDLWQFQDLLNGEKTELGKKSICIFSDTKLKKVYFLEPSNGKQHAVEIVGKFAEGTGAGIALGAMLAGKTAVEAVKIAGKVDINTGGRVRFVNVRT